MKKFIREWFWSINSDWFFLGLSFGILVFSPNLWFLGFLAIFIFSYLIYKYYTENKK